MQKQRRSAAPSPGSASPGDDSRSSRKPVMEMAGDELRAYAQKVGVSRRDIASLGDDRLRQSCIVMIHEMLEA